MQEIILESDISGHLVMPLTQKQGVVERKIDKSMTLYGGVVYLHPKLPQDLH